MRYTTRLLYSKKEGKKRKEKDVNYSSTFFENRNQPEINIQRLRIIQVNNFTWTNSLIIKPVNTGKSNE